jgi:hypothetical protein
VSKDTSGKRNSGQARQGAWGEETFCSQLSGRPQGNDSSMFCLPHSSGFLEQLSSPLHWGGVGLKPEAAWETLLALGAALCKGLHC